MSTLCSNRSAGSQRRNSKRRRGALGGLGVSYRRLLLEWLEDRCLLSVQLIRNGAFAGVVSPSDWATTGTFHADSRFTNYHPALFTIFFKPSAIVCVESHRTKGFRGNQRSRREVTCG
jgi:hypothetical protein